MHREAKEWERVGVGTYKIDIEKENHGLKGKKLDNSWGGRRPPQNHSGGGRETLRHPPVFALAEIYTLIVYICFGKVA